MFEIIFFIKKNKMIYIFKFENETMIKYQYTLQKLFFNAMFKTRNFVKKNLKSNHQLNVRIDYIPLNSSYLVS